MLGLGAGVALQRGRERALQRQLREHAIHLRRFVIPVLEERASALALPESERHRDVDDPLELTVRLSASLRATGERASLPFTDTLESPAVSAERERPRQLG